MITINLYIELFGKLIYCHEAFPVNVRQVFLSEVFHQGFLTMHSRNNHTDLLLALPLQLADLHLERLSKHEGLAAATGAPQENVLGLLLCDSLDQVPLVFVKMDVATLSDLSEILPENDTGVNVKG